MPRKICKRTVLIADIDLTTAVLMQEALREVGCESVIVRDGQKAVEKAVEMRPTLIVLDIILSGKNGLAVCQELKAEEETAGIPILVYSLLDLPKRSLAAGADAFLKKPLVRSKFIKKVRKLVCREEEVA